MKIKCGAFCFLCIALVASASERPRSVREPENTSRGLDADVKASINRLLEDENSPRLQQPPELQAILAGDIKTFKKLVPSHHTAAKRLARGFTWLHIASLCGKKEIVQYLLDQGVPIDAEDASGNLTPLILAVIGQNADVVGELLTRGADPNHRCRGGVTAIFIAAALDSVEILKLLIDKGASVTSSDDGGNSPLHVVAERGSAAAATLMLDHGGRVNDVNWLGDTPLITAAKSENVDVVKVLLDRGADPGTENELKRTALHAAALHGNLEIAKMLFAKGARINVPDTRGWTPFMAASEGGSVEMLEYLVEHGADVRYVEPDGTTALHHAAHLGRTDAVMWLLERGIDVNIEGHEGVTPLYSAASGNRLDIVEILAQHKADVNHPTTNGWTPLHISTSHGNLKMVQLLIQLGADVNAKSKSGWSVLCEAADQEKEITAALLEARADPNATCGENWTPLLVAINAKNIPVAFTLIDHGANVNATNQNGYSLMNYAVFREHRPIAEALLNHGADANFSYHGWTLLNDAVWRGYADMVKLLIQHGADVNKGTPYQQTPLIIAAKKGYVEIVNDLLDVKADPWKTTTNGLTAWHAAALIGRSNVTQLLEARVPGMPPTNHALVRVYFELDDPDAQHVSVAGFFNDTNDHANPLSRDTNGIWTCEVNLFDTWYEYRFVVDGQWIIDPANPDQFDDAGDPTSLMWATNFLASTRNSRKRPSLTRPQIITIAYSNSVAREVFASGEFNAWSTTSLPMKRTNDTDWIAITRLRPGKYGYKLIVDKVWILDPAQPALKVVNGVTNSLLVVPPVLVVESNQR